MTMPRLSTDALVTKCHARHAIFRNGNKKIPVSADMFCYYIGRRYRLPRRYIRWKTRGRPRRTTALRTHDFRAPHLKEAGDDTMLPPLLREKIFRYHITLMMLPDVEG